MIKNWRVFKEMLRLRFHGMMVFRLDFFGPFFVDGTLFIVQLMAFSAIYANVDTIGSWGEGEMMMYIGTFSLINAINMILFFFGVNSIPKKVKSGELDLYLSKPISPLFRLTFEKMSPGSIPLVLMSLCIIAYGVQITGKTYSVGAMLSYCFWIVLMVILYYELEVLLRCISLFIVTTASIEQIEVAGLSLCMRLPGIAFYGVYKLLFYLILPYGLMATLPVQSIIGEMSVGLALYGVVVVILFGILTSVVWKEGLKHYNSASS